MTNGLSNEYQLCHAVITRTISIKNLGASFDSKLHFHNHVDFLFSEYIKLFGLIRSITFFALEKLSLRSLRKWRHHLYALFFFTSIMDLNPAIPS